MSETFGMWLTRLFISTPKEKELVLEYLRPVQDTEFDKEAEEF